MEKPERQPMTRVPDKEKAAKRYSMWKISAGKLIKQECEECHAALASISQEASPKGWPPKAKSPREEIRIT